MLLNAWVLMCWSVYVYFGVVPDGQGFFWLSS